MKKITLTIATLAIMIVSFSACNNAKQNKQNKISGTYVCTEHWNDALVGNIKIVFSDDNKVSLAGVANTSYRIDGDSIFVDMHSYEMSFKIDGDVLRTSGSAGIVAYTKK
ncbi:MAG: hypothetical protein PF487_11590 [Bacteroidales bacterium]|jgi:hypothetical protein|nr:hypothetical protein [Bacteroidales bacterium]